MKKYISNPILRFVVSFIALFAFFYYFNLFFFSITAPSNPHYSAFLDHYLNYIRWLRLALLQSSTQVLNWLGKAAISNEYFLLVAGYGKIKLVYSCLGFGVCSFFAAFVLSYPKKWKPKIIFLVAGVFVIQVLNVCRFVGLFLFWKQHAGSVLDHHDVFNLVIYVLIAISIYFWVKHDDKKNSHETAN